MSPRQRMNGLEKCSVCQKMLKDSKEGAVFWLDTCNHYYHVACLKKYIKEKLNATQYIIECACEDCNEKIELKKLQKIMSRREFETLKKLHEKWSRHSLSNIVECPNPNCKFYFEKEDHSLRHHCTSCQEVWCLACKVPYHEKMSCKEYRKLHEK